MYLKNSLLFLITCCLSTICIGQYHFSGFVDKDMREGDLYLSLVTDYRKASGIHPEQIINKTTSDSTGYFSFSGDNIPTKNNIYRIHIDSCTDSLESSTHFIGHCANSKEILFIASNNDTITLPFSGEYQMFCDIKATNEKANALLRIDSLKEVMSFEFSNYTSKTSKDLNAIKWFKKFQEFGIELEEPLAELYSYAFLSDRSTDLYPYYLKNLKHNDYYIALHNRLKERYPNSSFIQQYDNELKADTFIVSAKEDKIISLERYALITGLFLSIIMNIYLIYLFKKRKFAKSKEQLSLLTNQEKKVLDYILEDKTNKEIATALFVSLSTVKTHINNIYKKLDVSSREELKSSHTAN